MDTPYVNLQEAEIELKCTNVHILTQVALLDARDVRAHQTSSQRVVLGAGLMLNCPFHSI